MLQFAIFPLRMLVAIFLSECWHVMPDAMLCRVGSFANTLTAMSALERKADIPN
jgi:hypothetical protein